MHTARFDGGNRHQLKYKTDLLKTDIFRKLMILHTWQIPLFLLPNSEKNVFNTKRRMLRADIAA
jgi:hypothetical protein